MMDTFKTSENDDGSYIDLEVLQHYLATGREVEFYYHKTKYYIANSSQGYILLEVFPGSDTESKDISDSFNDTNEFLLNVKIANNSLKEIFSKHTKNIEIVFIY